MRHCLVVAHQTLDSPRLGEVMLEETSREPCTFHLVVPVTSKGEGLTYTDAQVRASAQERLNQALSSFRMEGFAVDGEVGGPSPVDSVADAILRDGPDHYDLVIVSTLPHAISRWLRIDVPTRIQRATGLPVRHVEAPVRAESG
jgi:hypothetical protein